ncbi:hypothetical protein FH972_014902 [Carpinus fangiana]|uniref:Uncharacterized protein n=1 Tax=Carpinus fangiana TaxID=176857 RepID=A0A5N6RBQ7_9ROSI|nr:hypothetical protein FH972_014902 [Carpinus fangiana]
MSREGSWACEKTNTRQEDTWREFLFVDTCSETQIQTVGDANLRERKKGQGNRAWAWTYGLSRGYPSAPGRKQCIPIASGWMVVRTIQ